MKEYIGELNGLIDETIVSIKKLENKYLGSSDDAAIKASTAVYTTVLDGLKSFREDIVSEVTNKCASSSKDVKIVLDKYNNDYLSATNAESDDAASYIITKSPFIIETKKGKKIVLNEDPVSYRTVSGKKIVLDKDPIGNRLILDEDPISIDTKSGKKIILDEDPVKNTIVGNNVAVIDKDSKGVFTSSPWSSYNNDIAFITDSEPIVVEMTNGKKLVLDEDPIAFKTVSGKKLVLKEDPIKGPKKKRIVLDEDPVSVKLKSGRVIVLDEDPIINKVERVQYLYLEIKNHLR